MGSERMGIARDLAERVVGTRYADLPQEAVYWGKVALRDTIGVALAGSTDPAPRILEEVLDLAPSSGPSLILGTKRRVGALDAALLNGTAAHALDFDNATNTMFGHVSATMIPALLAAAEVYGATGADLLLAHAVGFETGARLGAAVNLHHYEKGWHPTSTLGVFAVAAACARLLHLSVADTETALAMSTSFAAGIKANFGSMTKPLHVGQCARSGLLAVLLARKGFTAGADAFEHKQGFFNVFNGAGRYDASRIFENWGKPWDIVEPGACFKQYPCCASTHAAVDAARELVKSHGLFDSKSVERIVVRGSAVRLNHVNRPQPQSGLDAKFSLQYCVARALVDGQIVLDHFEGDTYRDAKVQALMPRVQAEPYDPAHFGPNNHVGAELEVTLADGTLLSKKFEQPVGRTSRNPIGDDQLRMKFANCASRVLAPEAVASAIEMIDRLEELDSMRGLMKLLEAQTRYSLAL